MALKNLFVKDTRIIVTWEDRFAKIQLVYNDLIAPYKTIVEHWELFASLGKYFTNDNASFGIVFPSQFSSAMKTLDGIRKAYESNRKMCFIFDEKVQALQVLDVPPNDFIIKYELAGSDLIRILPENTYESDDNWTVWNHFLWHLPSLSDIQLKGFRRKKIVKDDLIQFLKTDLPLYRNAGQQIECEIDIKDEPACTIQLAHVERDSIDLIVKWSVIIDSVNPEFDIWGYVLSDSTVYSGLNPLEIEKYCPNIAGTNKLKFSKIAQFLDEAYQKWLPWITGDIQQFEAVHNWLEPPFHSFLKVDFRTQNGIGQAIGQPYILIANECLSARVVNDALSSDYYHLLGGWIRTTDLKASIGKKIAENTLSAMAMFALTNHQVLHHGDKTLSDQWQDILFANNYPWYTGSTKVGISSAHFEYLFKQGHSGGLIGGFEAFMAYGLPYLIEYLKQNKVKSIIILPSEYKANLSTIIENTPVLKDSGIEMATYYNLKEVKLEKNKIGVIIEPDELSKYEQYSDFFYSIVDNCDLNMCFLKKQIDDYSNGEKASIARIMKTDYPEDLPYLIRNVHESHDAPPKAKFPEDLNLQLSELYYHE